MDSVDTVCAPPRKFGALRDGRSGPYIVGGALSMMADNVEHVLAYWVLWQTFHSPWPVGFQIVSHWLPCLLFSVAAGALAERFDPRRIIQIAQALFMAVSFTWGVIFLTGTLELWHACVLLVLHGLAGCLWMPAEQMMLYKFAGPDQLPGAIRMNATFRSLAMLAGPVVGSALLLGLGPPVGMFVSMLFYLPLTMFLWFVRIDRRSAAEVTPSAGRDAALAALDPVPSVEAAYASEKPMTFLSAFAVLGTIRQDRQLLGMILLSALSAATVGAVIQNAMPEFAEDLGAGSAGLAYGALLFANGAGGVIGGFLLEATGRVPTTARTAVISATLLGISTLVFAVSPIYAVTVVALVVGGIARITSEATEMSIVQLRAPDDQRGRVIGAYTMFGPGMMTFSGVTVGVLGSLFGLRGSVLLGGIVLTVGAVLIGITALRPEREQNGDSRAPGTWN
ncbi:MFS transporter [Gordonia sp. MP11Mi]|uniref:Major facilitator superfamily (MFS) profile domain-containing protein n=1 Tax=Gordonia sp. MP11Mi TaxID=3022769 RepID=A0AA97GUX3_9ACTN